MDKNEAINFLKSSGNLGKATEPKEGDAVVFSADDIKALNRRRWMDRATGLGIGLAVGAVGTGVGYSVGKRHGAATTEEATVTPLHGKQGGQVVRA